MTNWFPQHPQAVEKEEGDAVVGESERHLDLGRE